MDAGHWTGIIQKVEAYYTAKVREHGPTAQGVDWNSEQSQRLRFRQLLKIVQDSSVPFCIIDYGCGYGALLEELTELKYSYTYVGYDISTEMLARAIQRHGRSENCLFLDNLEKLRPADYVVASGIFNVRLEIEEGEWRRYVFESISRLAALSTRGFAFNILTSYSDPERRKPQLYYGDPCEFFDHCKRNYSRSVALLHDYGLYEFTILVRNEEPFSWQK